MRRMNPGIIIPPLFKIIMNRVINILQQKMKMSNNNNNNKRFKKFKFYNIKLQITIKELKKVRELIAEIQILKGSKLKIMLISHNNRKCKMI